MKAHVIHDASGTIKSVVFQSTDVEGELEISTEDAADQVTMVDVDDAPAGAPGDELSTLGKKIRTDFKVGKGRKLEKLKG